MQRRAARNLRRTLARLIGDDVPAPWVDVDVARLAVRVGLATAVEAAVTRALVPHGLSSRHRGALRTAAAREQGLVMASEHEAARVVQILDDQGIEVVALKGLVSNREVHAPRGWCRAPGDVDLLVRETEAQHALAVIAARPEYHFLEGYSDAFYAGHHHLRPFIRRQRGATPIEVHRRISGTTTGRVAIDHVGCWERSVPFSSLGPRARRLDDVDQCLATIVHVDRDDAYTGRARQLFDLALWRERCADRVDELWRRAETWNARTTVARAFYVLDAFLGRRTRGSSEELPPRVIRGLWQRLALESTIEPGFDTVPDWYMGNVLRILTHEPSAARVARSLVHPLLSRWQRPN